MDGRGQVVIIDKEIYNPSALTIDYTNKRIYWADDNHILLANMDGTQRRKGEPGPSANMDSIAAENRSALQLLLTLKWCRNLFSMCT